MAPSIGLNLRVTGYKHQGGRKYMEDEFGVAYQQTADEKDLEYAFFGIFDGHGGREAALFAKEHLMDFIVRQKGFWAEDDESVLKAIHEGFIQTHYAMWKELEKWPKTASGLPSTAGTTASIAFIRRGKIYVGHVGDSAIVLGYQDPDNPDIWRAEPLTRDHKPESLEESERITQCGGKVICKSGVPRVVWNRPKMGHKGPVRRSTHIDEIPFLAVARSLGDLWSYNSEENVFVVSPEPDIRVYPVDISQHRCLILATDGCWNMLTPQNAISSICAAERANEQHMLAPVEGKSWINPSKHLVDCAIDRWNGSKLRADNTSVVTVMLDPPGPPRAQVLKNRKRELAVLNNGREFPTVPGMSGSVALVTNTTSENLSPSSASADTCHDVEYPPAREHPRDLDLGNVPDSDVSTSSDSDRLTGPISPSTSSDNVQCNEVSSSEDSPSLTSLRDGLTSNEPSTVVQMTDSNPSSQDSITASTSTSQKPKSYSNKSRVSLSRELSSLQLYSPNTKTVTRSQTSSKFQKPSSKSPKVIAKKASYSSPKKLQKIKNSPASLGVQQRVKAIEAKLNIMETKVSRRTTQMKETNRIKSVDGRSSRSTRVAEPPGSKDPSDEVIPKLLRSRTPVTPKFTNKLTPTKRKRTETPKRDSHITRKSPRTVLSKTPKVTISKQARVLKLRK